MTDVLPVPHADRDFLVDLGARPATGGGAWFAELTIAGIDVTADGFSTGDAPASPPAKIGSIHKANDVTLKRGVLDSDHLAGWLGADRTQVRTVRVALLSEDRATTLATWVLDRARIIRLVSRPIDSDGTDVDVDELKLTCEGISLGCAPAAPETPPAETRPPETPPAETLPADAPADA